MKIKISSNLIKDIINKNNIDIKEITANFSTKIQNMQDKLDNEEFIELTYANTRKLAKNLDIPFGYLFLKEYKSIYKIFFTLLN